MSERIGPYVLGARLGVGGMGVVHAARDEALQRTVALKVISPHLADDDEFRARFVREARAMASLDSPHVVHVYAHGEDAGRLWIASQLVPDGDLGTLLRRSGAPPLPLALHLVAQVASGLADAHAAGLVHRDIKPPNVLLRRTGSTYHAYLADFGIARRAGGDLTGLTQGVVGTPSYMAPELHTGGAPGVATDVYSLGCLLWSTLVGHAPYAGTSDYQVVTAHLGQPVPQLEGDTPVIHEVNRVLRIAMAKESAARYPTAAQMRDDLRAVERLTLEQPTVLRAGSVPSRDRSDASAARPRADGRVRLLAGAGLVLLLVLGGGVVTWLAVRGDDGPSRDPVTTSSSTSSTPSATSSPTPLPPGSSSPTLTVPTLPTPGSPPERYTEDDRLAALKSFRAALGAQPTIDQGAANCIASDVMNQMGLDGMVDAGFFDESMNYVDRDLSNEPEVRAYFTKSTLACLSAINY